MIFNQKAPATIITGQVKVSASDSSARGWDGYPQIITVLSEEQSSPKTLCNCKLGVGK